MQGKGTIPPPRPPYAEVDEFGLPWASLLERASESPIQRERRLRSVKTFAFRAFQAVVAHLGEDAARTLFKSFASDPKRSGRQSGSTNPQRDTELLARYDAALRETTTETDRKAIPRNLAESLARERGTPFQFGNSPEAIEKLLPAIARRRR